MKLWKRIPKTYPGMSLVEVMVAMALTSGVALGLAAIMQHAIRQSKSTQASVDFTQLASLIQLTLNDEEACPRLFDNITIPNTGPGTELVDDLAAPGSGKKIAPDISSIINTVVYPPPASSAADLKVNGKTIIYFGPVASGLQIDQLQFLNAKPTWNPDVGNGQSQLLRVFLINDPSGIRPPNPPPSRYQYDVDLKVTAHKVLGGGNQPVGLQKLDKVFHMKMILAQTTDDGTSLLNPAKILRCYGQFKEADSIHVCRLMHAYLEKDGTCRVCPNDADPSLDGSTCECKFTGQHFNKNKGTGECECTTTDLWIDAYVKKDGAAGSPTEGQCICKYDILKKANGGHGLMFWDHPKSGVLYENQIPTGLALENKIKNQPHSGLFCSCPGYIDRGIINNGSYGLRTTKLYKREFPLPLDEPNPQYCGCAYLGQSRTLFSELCTTNFGNSYVCGPQNNNYSGDISHESLVSCECANFDTNKTISGGLAYVEGDATTYPVNDINSVIIQNNKCTCPGETVPINGSCGCPNNLTRNADNSCTCPVAGTGTVGSGRDRKCNCPGQTTLHLNPPTCKCPVGLADNQPTPGQPGAPNCGCPTNVGSKINNSSADYKEWKCECIDYGHGTEVVWNFYGDSCPVSLVA